MAITGYWQRKYTLILKIKEINLSIYVNYSQIHSEFIWNITKYFYNKKYNIYILNYLTALIIYYCFSQTATAGCDLNET